MANEMTHIWNKETTGTECGDMNAQNIVVPHRKNEVNCPECLAWYETADGKEFSASRLTSLSSETKTCVCAPVEHVHAEHCPCSDAVPASSPAAQKCKWCGKLIVYDTAAKFWKHGGTVEGIAAGSCYLGGDENRWVTVEPEKSATPSTPPSPKTQDDDLIQPSRPRRWQLEKRIEDLLEENDLLKRTVERQVCMKA